ncbi:MAG: 3-methylcrotonyl-CoA carboxylase, partial [Myxococcales bacterium]|nr:3-methylcrotonyl-CoA carboxylase [Myxococcales bacterium]
EEAPSPGLNPETRDEICAQAVKLVSSIDYVGAGTVEFLVDDASGEHFFLEVNARIQVEHPVTELVTRVDLVQAQLRVAMGEPLAWTQDQIEVRGHAVEVRLCAEDPQDDHRPQAGPILTWRPPDGIRVDSALNAVDEVSVYYDSMVAKLIAFGADRATAIRKLRRALDETELYGIANNQAFLAAVLDHSAFRAGHTTTQFLIEHKIAPQQSALSPSWYVAAALVRNAQPVSRRWRSNPSRADVTVIERTNGEFAHVYLEQLDADTWRFAVDQDPEPALHAPMLADQRVQILGQGQGWIRLEISGFVQTYRVTDVEAGLWIQRPGHCAERLQEGTLLPAPEVEQLDEGAVVAPSAAMVTQVHVQSGQTIDEGAALVTVEAMKMLTVLKAPRAGTIEAVNCAQGDNVSSGQVLVELSAEDDETP